MASYSTLQDIEVFKGRLGDNPICVCDADGNILEGYTLAEGRDASLPRLDLSRDNPQSQSIPYGTPPSTIAQLVSEGTLLSGVFSSKAMDARLPAPLVDIINNGAVDGSSPFRLTILTSRAAEHVIKILEESGVKDPKQNATVVADSGATLYIRGKVLNIRPLSHDEDNFLKAIGERDLLSQMQVAVSDVLQQQGFDTPKCPSLFIESKGIATNVHYREILGAYAQPDGSPLDIDIAKEIKRILSDYIDNGPKEENGDNTFKLLDGPATVEVKIASVNKGLGLKKIIEEAQTYAVETGTAPPSAVVFSGDDVAKLGADGAATPGTDYFAMKAAPVLQELYAVPVLNIHTHHAAKGGISPDPGKAAELLGDEAPRIDLVVPNPTVLRNIIVDVLAPKSAVEKAVNPMPHSLASHEAVSP